MNELKPTSKELEQAILAVMNRKHLDKLSLSQCLAGKSETYCLIFFSRMKNFVKLRRWYEQKGDGVITYFIRV